jgi:FtsZ-binding cell division protein ZapB
MSQDVVKEAEKVVSWWDSMYIVPTSLQPNSEVRNQFIKAVASFHEAKTNGGAGDVPNAALNLLNQYSLCIKENLLTTTSSSLASMQQYKDEVERLRLEIETLKEKCASDTTASRERYEELLERYATLKGRYEEVAERLDKMSKQS